MAPRAVTLADSAGTIVRTFGPGESRLPRFPHNAHKLLLGRVDPFGIACRFPGRWQRYCLDHFGSEAELACAFGVDVRTARKWRDGQGGCNGDKVAMAMARHPDSAGKYLFAAE